MDDESDGLNRAEHELGPNQTEALKALRAQHKLPNRIPWQVVLAVTHARGAQGLRIAIAIAKDERAAKHLSPMDPRDLPGFFRLASSVPVESDGNLLLASAGERRVAGEQALVHAKALRLLIEQTPALRDASVFTWLRPLGMDHHDWLLSLMPEETEQQCVEKGLAGIGLGQITLIRVLEAVEHAARLWRGSAPRYLRSIRDRYVIALAGFLRKKTGTPHVALVRIATGHALGDELTPQAINRILSRALIGTSGRKS